MVIPFSFPTTLPSKDVPVPNGTTGILCLLQSVSILETSSLLKKLDSFDSKFI